MPLPKSVSTTLQPLLIGRRRPSASPSGAPPNHLNMTMQTQQQANWCWSAVSVSIKLFFSPGTSITQCDQANRQLSQTTCCGTGGADVCNVTWYLYRALSGLGNLAAAIISIIPFDDLVTQIRAGRPVGCRIVWLGGGAHFVAIDGCDPASPNQLITVKDPISGTSVLAYDTFATSYQGVGSWAETCLTKP